MGEGQIIVTALVLKGLWGKARNRVLLYNQIWLIASGENSKISVANKQVYCIVMQKHTYLRAHKAAVPVSACLLCFLFK